MMNSNGVVPPPSSLLRKNNSKRLSMALATRSSLLNSGRNSNLVESLSSVPSSIKRRSLLSTPATRRQSSFVSSQQSHRNNSQQHNNNNNNNNNGTHTPRSHSRSLSIVPSQSQSQGQSQSQSQSQSQAQSQTGQGQSTQDNRPLRDKNYQTLLLNEIYEFLSVNKFELEMNHPLTSKTLKQPTQKDFIVIFQFLYNKIDPFYRFTRSIETEVFTLLKVLNYPYLDGINRSQISAVGGTYWPTFLGMLYWLVKLNLQLSDIHGNTQLSTLEDELDQIFVNYIKNSYRAFINEQDDFSEFFNEMKQGFDEFNEKVNQEVIQYQQTNNALTEEFNGLNNELLIIENAEKKSKALENDLIKFKAYIETMESRKTKWNDALNKISQEIDNCDEELRNIENEKKDYETKINERGSSIKYIDNLNTERDSVSKTIDMISNKSEDLRYQINIREIEYRKNYESLENFINQYNNIIYKIQSSNPVNYKFEIKLNPDMINNYTKPFNTNEVLNKILKEEKIELLKLRTEINTKVHQYQDELIKLQEQNDLISEQIMEQREELESLETKLSIDKSNYDEIYETMINDNTTYSMQIEKLDRELRSIKINTNQEFIEIENRYQNVSIEFDEFNHEILKQRSLLHDNVQKIIETTINFKLNIQQNLEDLEVLVTDEFERESAKFNE